MASATLITFFLLLPRNAKRVELFGSWDNFRKPYPMHRDKDVGPTNWRGCFSFSDIVCDGEDLLGSLTKRDGALLMGGTYWYFYRLDDETEYCTPHEPSTTACPLLPGQFVNLLEMPVEMAAHGPSSPAALRPELECVFTLNPEDKFKAKPKAPTDPAESKGSGAAGQSQGPQPGKASTSRLSQARFGDSELSRDLLQLKCHGFDGSFREDDDADRRRSLPPSRRESLRSTFRRLRPNRSIHLPRNHWDKAESSVTGLPVSGTCAELAGVPSYYTSVTSDMAELPGSTPPKQAPKTYTKRTNKPIESSKLLSDKDKPEQAQAAIASGLKLSERDDLPCQSNGVPQPPALQPAHSSSTAKKSLTIRTRPEGQSWLQLDQLSLSPADATLEADLQRVSAQHDRDAVAAATPSRQARKHLSLASSNRTSGVFSMDSAQADPDTEPSSPAPRDSQPITPTLGSSFDAAPLVYARPTAYAAPHANNSTYGPDPAAELLQPDDPVVLAWQQQQRQYAWPPERAFPGYSLPAEQHASEQTLRPPRSGGKARPATPGVVRGTGGGTPGSNNGRSALDELVEDMGYLGALIA